MSRRELDLVKLECKIIDELVSPRTWSTLVETVEVVDTTLESLAVSTSKPRETCLLALPSKPGSDGFEGQVVESYARIETNQSREDT